MIDSLLAMLPQATVLLVAALALGWWATPLFAVWRKRS